MSAHSIVSPRTPERVVQQQIVHLLRSVGAAVFVLGTRRARSERDHGTHQTPGVPDVLALLPRGHGLLSVECKAAGGRLSPAQLLWAQRSIEAGHEHVIGGVTEVADWLIEAGLLRDTSLPWYRRTSSAKELS